MSQNDAKVIGHQTADSGETYGVWGEVNSSDGYGLYTPDDAKVDGTAELSTVDTSGGDFTLAAGTTSTNDATNVVLGHEQNDVIDGAIGATIAGGGSDDGSTHRPNIVSDDYGTISGGENNTASGNHATVSGGDTNVANNQNAAVGGGKNNQATGNQSVVAGGSSNVAGGINSAIGGGFDNAASGTMATVAGGMENQAAGQFSFATGRQATADHDGAVVFGDSSTNAITSNFADVALFQQRLDIGDGGVDNVRLLVEGDSAVDDYLLRVRDSGSTKFLVHDNGGAAVGSLETPPADGLHIQGSVDKEQVGVSAYLSSNQSIPDSNETTIDFDALQADRDDFGGGFDTSTGIYTVQEDGDYHIDCHVFWQLADWTSDFVDHKLYVDGSLSNGIENHFNPAGFEQVSQSLSKGLFGLSAGDTIKLRVRHTGGESRDMVGNADGSKTYMTIHKIG